MGEKKKRILLALGSTSDGKSLLGNEKLAAVVDAKPENIDLDLSIASAHRMPYRVKAHANLNVSLNFLSKTFACEQTMSAENVPPDPEYVREYIKEYDIVIAGAGLANALISAYMADAHAIPTIEKDTIFIGLPIFDKATGGLSSLLSTQEMPPGCPVGCVGIDRIDAATGLAVDLAAQKYEKVILVDHSGGEGDKCIEKLGLFGIDVEKMEIPQRKSHQWKNQMENDVSQLLKNLKDKPGSIILFPYSESFYETGNLLEFDDNESRSTNIPHREDWSKQTMDKLRIYGDTHLLAYIDVLARQQSDVVIASYLGSSSSESELLNHPNFVTYYARGISGLNRTLNVRFGGLENMAILTAKIIASSTGNEAMKKAIFDDFKKGLKKYDGWESPVRIESSMDLSDAVVECSSK